ncbi:hypothetical protein [Bradyrhizobium sp. RT9a]|uniref:hypothetical protein n=1 Tax=Bradyrhizobium sp. RT9a TaxID=3156384 RepID=UPI003392720E
MQRLEGSLSHPAERPRHSIDLLHTPELCECVWLFRSRLRVSFQQPLHRSIDVSPSTGDRKTTKFNVTAWHNGYQCLAVFATGLSKHSRSIELDDLSCPHHRNPMGNDHSHVVTDEHHGNATFASQVLDQLQNLC